MPAVVAVCRITLRLRSSRSLKDKREVVSSLQARLRNTYGLSVAETDYQDKRQMAELLAVLATSDAVFAASVIDQVRKFLDDFHLPIETVDFETDIFPPF